jgi:hypothetical protein
MRGSQGI